MAKAVCLWLSKVETLQGELDCNCIMDLQCIENCSNEIFKEENEEYGSEYINRAQEAEAWKQKNKKSSSAGTEHRTNSH